MSSMQQPVRTVRKTIFVRGKGGFSITTGYDPVQARTGDIPIRTRQVDDGDWEKQMGILTVPKRANPLAPTASELSGIYSSHMSPQSMRVSTFNADLKRHGMVHDQMYVVRFFDLPN